MRVWRGGSIARNDIVVSAFSWKASRSRETPWRFEKVSMSLKAASTSAWRESAQKPSASFR